MCKRCHFLTHALLQTIYTGWNASLTARRIVNGFGGAPAAWASGGRLPLWEPNRRIRAAATHHLLA